MESEHDMSDHDKLREAIASLRKHMPRCSPQWAEELQVVADAAESTLPKTKMVEVWHVTYAHRVVHPFNADTWRCCCDCFDAEQLAREVAGRLGSNANIAGIRVTGPHHQEVPQ